MNSMLKCLPATAAFLLICGNAHAADVKAFVGASLIDGTGKRLTSHGVIVVRDGKVEAVGPAAKVKPPGGAQIVNLAGKFVTPGLISAHVHVSDVNGARPAVYNTENTLRQLGVFARYGITTVWSLGGEKAPAFEARDTQDTSSLNRARIYVAGDVITGKTPDEARRMVAKVAAGKPDVIKIRVDDQLGTTIKMSPEVYRAIIDEAHRRGLRVAAHIFYLDDAKDLLRAGADYIAHSVRDKDIDDEFIKLMQARDVPYCPTLTREISTFAYQSVPAFFADPFFLREADREVVEQLKQPSRQEAMRKSSSAQAYKAGLVVAKRNLKKATDAGLLIAMGTDSGASANRFEGYFEHLEMEMMAEAGLTPAQILQSATSAAARTMRVQGIGDIAVGYWADLVVFDRDPLADIRNIKSLSQVWIAGNRVTK
jgi:imidazolonepropionase-like amidohydrolase